MADRWLQTKKVVRREDTYEYMKQEISVGGDYVESISYTQFLVGGSHPQTLRHTMLLNSTGVWKERARTERERGRGRIRSKNTERRNQVKHHKVATQGEVKNLYGKTWVE